MMAADVARQLEIPENLFAGLLSQESGWNPTAKNPRSSATGLGQFIEATARGQGLRVAKDVDDRTDPAKSIVASGNYLRSLYDKFGDLNKAIEAYSTGEGGQSTKESQQHLANVLAKAKSEQKELKYLNKEVPAPEWYQAPFTGLKHGIGKLGGEVVGALAGNPLYNVMGLATQGYGGLLDVLNKLGYPASSKDLNPLLDYIQNQKSYINENVYEPTRRLIAGKPPEMAEADLSSRILYAISHGIPALITYVLGGAGVG